MWLKALPDLKLPEDIIEDTEDRQIINRYTPLGVACGIVPWNYPVLLACGKIAPALYTGNAIILKPSPYTPYCDLKLGELGQQFFPSGVFQVLSGGDDLGPMLTSHPGIDKVSFTGSSVTGKKVMESCSKTLKRVTLELGGNDPAIICEDVDIEKVIPKVKSPQRSALTVANRSRVPDHTTLLPMFQPNLHDDQTSLRPRIHLPSIPRRNGQAREDPKSRARIWTWCLLRPRPKQHAIREGQDTILRHHQGRVEARCWRHYWEVQRLLHHSHHYWQPSRGLSYRDRRAFWPYLTNTQMEEWRGRHWARQWYKDGTGCVGVECRFRSSNSDSQAIGGRKCLGELAFRCRSWRAVWWSQVERDWDWVGHQRAEGVLQLTNFVVEENVMR